MLDLLNKYFKLKSTHVKKNLKEPMSKELKEI